MDLGVRLGLTAHADVTVEYNVNSATTRTGTIHPNEMLATLRVGF